MIDGIRRKLLGETTRDEMLVNIVGADSVNKALTDLMGEDCIWTYSHFSHRINPKLAGLHFSGGLIGRVEEKTLFRKAGGFGFAISDLYDVVRVEELKKLDYSRKDIKDLEIFTFSDSAGDDSERAEVIHFDALSAYLSVREKLRGGRPSLKKVEPLQMGHVAYWYEVD